jgi:hypothetical protein
MERTPPRSSRRARSWRGSARTLKKPASDKSQRFSMPKRLTARGCYAQAWSVAEPLRALIEELGIQSGTRKTTGKHVVVWQRKETAPQSTQGKGGKSHSEEKMPRSILHVLLIDRSDKSPNGLASHDYYITGSYHTTLQRRHPLGVVCYGSTAALVGAAQSPTPLLDLRSLRAVPRPIACRTPSPAPLDRHNIGSDPRILVTCACSRSSPDRGLPRQARVAASLFYSSACAYHLNDVGCIVY